MDDSGKEVNIVCQASCSRCSQFAKERHLREEAERMVDVLVAERDKYAEATRRALDELDQVSDTLSTLAILSEEYEALHRIHSESSRLIEGLAEHAFRFAPTLHDRSMVLGLATQVGCTPGETHGVTGVTGLPRLRVFTDEECHIQLAVLNRDGTTLWSSEMIPVAQSVENPTFWGTGLDAGPICSVPLGLFNSDAESKFAVNFESSVVAETLCISRDELVSSQTLQLFHDDVPLDSAVIVFVPELTKTQVLRPEKYCMKLQVLSIQGVEFDMESTGEEDCNPLVVVRSPFSSQDLGICIDEGCDGETPSGYLYLTAPDAQTQNATIDILLSVCRFTVAVGTASIPIRPRTKGGSLSIDLVSDTGVRNGSLLLGFSIERDILERSDMAAFRCG
jgi:hypothetical protein